ncbi:hypothetical protein CH063_01464 [Colletotrichum higginsianum]|uniref:Uncharacterized protein n=1 Tax=Colletotrichum higginsianum (strain IMI 349063) TaxID=759273 RepID=H1V7Q8_COLHI|nr:hypothetical protein CH063_01464 [Colletotrichum higginsianum]
MIFAARDAGRAAMNPRIAHSTRQIALTNWVNLMFIMTIGMAHEYVHCIVGAMRAGISPSTPLRVHFDLDEMKAKDEENLLPVEAAWMNAPDLDHIPPGFEQELTGESGFAWEARVLGGRVVNCSTNHCLKASISLERKRLVVHETYYSPRKDLAGLLGLHVRWYNSTGKEAYLRVAFALTCKYFFTTLCPTHQFPPPNMDDLLAILLLLGRDMPKWFLCFGCKRLLPLKQNNEGNLQGQLHTNCDSKLQIVREFLHQRPIRRRPIGSCRGVNSLHRWIESLSLVTWRPAVNGLERGVPEITFTEGHLIMNRHFYGTAHGLPTQHLESIFEFERSIPLDNGEIKTRHFPLDAYLRSKRYNLRPLRQNTLQAATRWTFTHETSAKVLDDELYICRHHDINGPPCCTTDFSRVIDSLELPVCRHILGSSKMPSLRFWEQGNTCIPELQSIRISATEPQLDVHPDNGVGSCRRCFTDYEIAIERGGDQRKWSLKLTTYHKLGSFRTLKDDAWLGLIQTTRPRILPEFHGKAPAGGVRKKWLQDRGKTSTAAGERSNSETSTHAGPLPSWLSSFSFMVKRRYSRFDGPSFDSWLAYRKAVVMCYSGQGEEGRPGSVTYRGTKSVGEILD